MPSAPPSQLHPALRRRVAAEPEPDDLINTFQAAQILGCSTSTVRKLVASGKLPKPTVVEPGHMRMHRRSAVLAHKAHVRG